VEYDKVLIGWEHWVRGSGSGGESAIHMVSAFATELGVVLGQEKVASKSNEITAIPELLKALYINGLLVSIDAMGKYSVNPWAKSDLDDRR